MRGEEFHGLWCMAVSLHMYETLTAVSDASRSLPDRALAGVVGALGSITEKEYTDGMKAKVPGWTL